MNSETPIHFWEPSAKLVLSIRRYQHWRKRWGLVGYLFCKAIVLRHRFWSVVTGADIPLISDIGLGVTIRHPNGVVIHPAAKIGVNCFISHQVTIGVGSKPGCPTIGADVYIGAGAKIIGPIHIGDGAKIGANAVVLCDVPAGATAVGAPARIVKPQLSTPSMLWIA